MSTDFRIVTLDAFVAVDEPGADTLLGDDENALIPENGDVMVYGDGGAGKTTLLVDLTLHLAAGDAWLGIPVARPTKVLLIENEGPRPRFRKKLRRKRDAWTGSPLGDRVVVREEPWARFTLSEPHQRKELADAIQKLEIDVVILGPLSRSGMNEAGTLQEVSAFMALVAELRDWAKRRFTLVLIHHENKGGQVSGAWESSGDTLLHVQQLGRGRTRLHVQKARWDSSRHGARLELSWADGEAFAVDEKPELDDDAIAERILTALTESPGASMRRLTEAAPGMNDERRRRVRDRLLSERRIVNVAKDDQGNDVALYECPERKAARLYVAGDEAIRHLRLDPAAVEPQSAAAGAADDQVRLRPAARSKEPQAVAAAVSPPDEEEVERLLSKHADIPRAAA